MKLKSTYKVTQGQLVEFAESSIVTAQANPLIFTRLTHYGFTNEKLEEGSSLCSNYKNYLNQNKKVEESIENCEERYSNAYESCEAKFKSYRGKALLLFKRDPIAMLKLRIDGTFPCNFSDFVSMSSHFYETILNDKQIAQKAILIALTPEQLKACCNELIELKNLHEAYEQQLPTGIGNGGGNLFKLWLEEYIDTAKLAFFDEPNMLELLGIYERNS